ncbi:MAG: CinA family nicotinamide mononucleotide deamidase-related protein [Thermodesulfobacteriota bacterium]
MSTARSLWVRGRRIVLGEIIAIGNELTSGRISNTTSGFAARHLFEGGHEIYAMHTIGDTPDLIGEALLRAIGRVDFVVVTGGLGSTDDDMTNEAVSKALGRPTIPNLDILYRIRAHLDKNSAPAMNSLEKLAWLPEGADPLNSGEKMAGYQLIHDDTLIFFLPGIPYQMRILLVNHVLPRLRQWHDARQLDTLQRVYKIFPMDEVEVNRRVTELSLPEQIHIGYYPVFPEIHLSITYRGEGEQDPDELFREACSRIEAELGDSLYGSNRDTMASIVGDLCSRHNIRLVFAESCTGGLISQMITDVAGSSSYFLGGVVSYANSMKEDLVGVERTILEQHGAVSRQCAAAMAEGVLKASGGDLSLSVTGIAGPGGGTAEKPVGTVYMGLADIKGTVVHRFNFSGKRTTIRKLTAHTGLDLIRTTLLKRE